MERPEAQKVIKIVQVIKRSAPVPINLNCSRKATAPLADFWTEKLNFWDPQKITNLLKIVFFGLDWLKYPPKMWKNMIFEALKKRVVFWMFFPWFLGCVFNELVMICHVQFHCFFEPVFLSFLLSFLYCFPNCANPKIIEFRWF